MLVVISIIPTETGHGPGYQQEPTCCPGSPHSCG